MRPPELSPSSFAWAGLEGQAPPVCWGMSEVLEVVFSVDQPVWLDFLQDRGGDFFDGLGRGRQPTDA